MADLQLPRKKYTNENHESINLILTILIKPRTYIEYKVKPYIYTKFDGCNLKNEPRNATIVRLIKWWIMRIIKLVNLYNFHGFNLTNQT